MKSPLTILAFIITLAAAGDWGKSCFDETLDPVTDVLTATCRTGDGRGITKLTSLDLNDCYKYQNNKIEPSFHGNFSNSCTDCAIIRLPDPVYDVVGILHPWMNCTCVGAPTEVAINTDAEIDNRFGNLMCNIP
ncbi:CVNH domain-containing protein [Pseudomassariella vexata]|uniref:CVNH domain-containing protein n=1 Tax=Pseudomassariella vexata TaxID=1141098 RepID=A0A1Y2DZY3_9PEZI|nr:CVNH domain-containing protein [Pseudomassariella vexata]ORY64850.1 CVNH domain-containing protein [Pseudomassariella vexata]